jgi:HPt (histidine-containing phosphotransfer) domain-containing protein
MPSPKNEEPAPFLRREALERVGGDAEFLDDLLSLYDEEYASKMEGLRAAVAGKAFETIRELGHGLKGSSANLSFPGLQSAAWAMETAGREKDAAKSAAALKSLEREYQRLKKFLG